MKRLPDRYYDLVLERDQLLEEADVILNSKPIDALEFIDVTTKIVALEEEIHRIEQEVESEYNNKKYYIITREVYDIENDDFYSFINEYSTIAEALVEFAVQVRELKEAFTTYDELYEDDRLFFIRDEVETVSLAIHEIIVEQ